MSRLAYALLIGALWCSCTGVRAQLDTVELYLDDLTVEDGLPQGLVLAMAQDSTGYLWFGTKDGLARYDGYVFAVFRHDAKDSVSIGGDHITSLLADHNGYLWVGFAPFGLDRYDPRTGRFVHVRADGLDDGVALSGAERLCEDAHGRIWMNAEIGRIRSNAEVATTWHTFVVDPARSSDLAVIDPRELRPGIEPLTNGKVSMGPGGDPWFASPETIRCVHYGNDGSARLIDHNLGIRSWTELGLPLHPALIADPSSGQMLVTQAGFLMHMMPGQAVPVDTLHLPVNDFHYIGMLDHSGRLWGGPDKFDDHRLQVATGAVDVIVHGGDASSVRAAGAGFRGLFEDRTGNIWFSSNGFGAFRSQAGRERFKRVDAGELRWVYPGNSSGSVLLGSLLQGPAVRHGRVRPRTTDVPVLGPMTPLFIERGVVDEQGRIWTGERIPNSNDHRVVILDEGGSTPVASLADDRIRDVFPGPNNTVWMDNTNRGESLIHVDMRTGDVIGRYPAPKPLGSSDYLSISSMTHHPDGTVWMGTVAGLHHLDPKTGVWKVYKHDEHDPHSLPHDMVFTTCLDPADPQHVLWVGTNGGGLSRFDQRTQQFTTWTTKDGLPNNVVYSILSDAHNNLWIGTNQGLVRFDPRTGGITTYTKEDGLPSNEFNRYCYAKTDKGELWFEGMGGAFHFNPEEFYGTIPASPTMITGMKLVGRTVAVAGLSSTTGAGYQLPAPIEYVHTITLPYSERMITFSFACMDHTAPLKNSFRYMLENFSKDWVEVGTVHEATFTNLDPGTYTFRVQGRNSTGVWDERGATMELTITPPWWGTWWFRTGALLVFVGALYAFYRYRLAQAVKVVRVRERIARDLHDEIGSTLSSVSLFSTVAQKKAAGKAPEASELLGRITDSTTQVLEAMNDIVWAVNADNDDMASVIKRMHAFAVSVTEARDCKLHLHTDEALRNWRLEMSQRKNLYLIFKEAVNNAMKYSGCTHLRVELIRDRSVVVLRVEDDGRGFDMNDGNGSTGGGNGLGNMRNRAAEIPGTLTITSANGQGTTVELRFVPGYGKRSLEPMMSGPEQAG